MSPFWYEQLFGVEIRNPKEIVMIDSTVLSDVVPHKRPLVIYHGNCADGFSAAWCFHHSQEAAPISYDFHAGVYGEEIPDVEDRVVYMVDFSYKSDKVEQILGLCKILYFIDHHKTAIEDLFHFVHHPKFVMYTDMERSGAMLAWDFLYNTVWEFNADGTKPKLLEEFKPVGDTAYKEPPMLLAHVQDRDLWRFKLDGTRPIQAGMFSYEYSFEKWDEMMAPDDGKAVQNSRKLALWGEGAAIERKHFKDIHELLAVCKREFMIGGFMMPVASMPYTLASDAGNIMAGEHINKMSACYYDTATHRVFSLRSIGDVDVSEIAKGYGGGGHKNAAGFKVPRSDALAMA